MATQNALTTAFTPPSDCFNTITFINNYYLYLADNTDTCYPSSYTYTSYYSPATACPSGFTSYYTSVITVGDVFETRAVCCPTVATSQWTGEGLMYWYSSYSVCTAWVSGRISGKYTGATGSTSISGTTTSSLASGYTTVTALPVLIAYQESDRRTGARSSSATASSGSSTGSTTGPTSSASPTVVPGSGGLSTGAKIGIGVAVPLVALAALFGLIFFIMKRRKNKQTAAAGAPRREIQQEFVQGRPLTQIEQKGDQKYMSPHQSPPYQYSQAHTSDYGEPPRWSQHGNSHMGSSPELTNSTYAPSTVRAPRGA